MGSDERTGHFRDCARCGDATPTWDLESFAVRAACRCGWTGDLTANAMDAYRALARHERKSNHGGDVEAVDVCGHCRVVLCDHDPKPAATPAGRPKCPKCEGVEVSA